LEWLEDYKQFFVKFNDCSYIKTLKLDVLTMLVCDQNIEAIVSEMKESVTDVSAEIAKHAIHCLGNIALKMEEFSSAIIQTLLDLFTFVDIDYVITETVVVIKDLLRKYPEQFETVRGICEKNAFEGLAM
jgi:vesicle coat complex subunit